MDQQIIEPLISQHTRDVLVPAGGTGILYLILSGQAMTFRLAIGALGAALVCGYFGAQVTERVFHLGNDWSAALGAAWGFVGHLTLMGVVKFGQLWRDDPKGLVATFLPFWRKP